MGQLAKNTGVRLTEAQFAKAARLAQSLGMTRNRLFGMLVDAAEVESQPAISVGLKNNRNAATKFEPQSSKAVGA